MNASMGRFHLYDTYQKKLLTDHYGFLSYNEVASLSVNEEGVYLESIGRRDRYVLIPMLPRKDKHDHQLWVGDVLTNDSGNLWVIRYDLLTGAYASLISMPSSRYQLDDLLSEGLWWSGTIFDGDSLDQPDTHKSIMKIDPMLFL